MKKHATTYTFTKKLTNSENYPCSATETPEITKEQQSPKRQQIRTC